LPLESACHLCFGKLLNGHGGEDVPRFEHLILILLLDVHTLVHCRLLDVELLESVRVVRVEGERTIRVLILLLGQHLLSEGAQHVGHVFSFLYKIINKGKVVTGI